MGDSTRPDPAPRGRAPEPIRGPARVACALFGALLVGLALVTAAAEPDPWLSLAPMVAGALLLMPVLGARASSEEEVDAARARAAELAACSRALLGPGCLGLLAVRLLESGRPGLALGGDAVGAMAIALIAALLVAGTGCTLAAAYQRARAGGD